MGKIIRKMLSIKIFSFLSVTSFMVGVLMNICTASASVLVVPPSGDMTGVIDADNLEAALNAVKAYGGTVYLTDGNPSTIDHYYVSRGIVIEDFSGTFKGTGKNLTIITNNGQEIETTLFEFVDGGDVTISNMGFKMTGDDVTPGNFYPVRCIIYLHGAFTTTLIDEVGFEGEYYSFYNVGYSVLLGYDVGLTGGSHTVSNCSFETVRRGVEMVSVQNSNVEVRNNSFQTLDTAILVFLCDDSHLKFSENTIDSPYMGIFATESNTSQIEILNNTITNVSGWDGISFYMNDNAVVRGNFISSAASYSCIYAEQSHDVVCIDNFFTGSPFSAAVELLYSNGWIITENRFTNIINVLEGAIGIFGNNNSILNNDYRESSLHGWVGGEAGCVFLWEWTHDNFVFESGNFPHGTNAKTQVADFGTNNRVVGHNANYVADPAIGQRLKEIQQRIEQNQSLAKIIKK